MNAENRLSQIGEEYQNMEEYMVEQRVQWEQKNEERFHTHNQLIQITRDEKQKDVEIEGKNKDTHRYMICSCSSSSAHTSFMEKSFIHHFGFFTGNLPIAR